MPHRLFDTLGGIVMTSNVTENSAAPQLRLTMPAFARPLLSKLLAIIATALLAYACSPAAFSQTPRAGGKRPPVTMSRPQVPQPVAPYQDPRYRPPVGISELRAVAAKVAKATGRDIRWRLELGTDPGPLALIRGGLDNCTILIHPVAARTVPPNTWAFIFGHEFAHRVENLGSHSQSNPSNELKADIAGARYAMAAGYRIESFLGWVLTEPNHQTKSHGSLRDRYRAHLNDFVVAGILV